MGRKRTVDIDLPEGIRRGKTAGTFEVRVSLPGVRDLNGRTRHREMVRVVRGGIREAKTRRAQMVAERDHQWGSDGSLSAHLRWWLDLAEPDRSPNTMRNYRAYTIRYINPALGNLPLKSLTTRQLTDFYQSLRARGLAPSTIRQCHSIIRVALAEAVDHGMLPANPAVTAKPPRLIKTEVTPPEVATYQAIYSRACAERYSGLGHFLRVAAGTGARRAEVCGLRWSDLDPAGSILIGRSIVEVKEPGRPGRLLVKHTKTDRPRRIALDPAVVATLAAHLQTMHARAQSAGTTLRPDGYIFSDELDGSRPWRPGRVTTAFYRICQDLGISCRLHDLRHMHATQLLAAGVDVRTVAGRLGHSNPTTTLGIYGHFVPAADRRAADVIGGLLHGPAGELAAGS